MQSERSLQDRRQVSKIKMLLTITFNWLTAKYTFKAKVRHLKTFRDLLTDIENFLIGTNGIPFVWHKGIRSLVSMEGSGLFSQKTTSPSELLIALVTSLSPIAMCFLFKKIQLLYNLSFRDLKTSL